MRHIVMAIGLMLVGGLAVTTGLVVTGAVAGEDAAGPDRTKWGDKDRLRVLEMEVAALQARERALTAYVMTNAQRADDLDALLAQCQKEGFLSRKHSTRSRITFFKGLAALAQSLRTGLPVASEEDVEMNAALAELLGAAEKARHRPKPAPKPAPEPAPAPEDDGEENGN